MIDELVDGEDLVVLEVVEVDRPDPHALGQQPIRRDVGTVDDPVAELANRWSAAYSTVDSVKPTAVMASTWNLSGSVCFALRWNDRVGLPRQGWIDRIPIVINDGNREPAGCEERDIERVAVSAARLRCFATVGCGLTTDTLTRRRADLIGAIRSVSAVEICGEEMDLVDIIARFHQMIREQSKVGPFVVTLATRPAEARVLEASVVEIEAIDVDRSFHACFGSS